MKDWPDWLKAQKALDMEVSAPGDMTNISVRLDMNFFAAYEDALHPHHNHAVCVYNETVASMLRTGEPGFQIDWDEQILRNACTEIISADDSDSCVLLALNFAKLKFDELAEAAEVGTAFLLAVTEYNQSPTPECTLVQHKNRRLGLGVMGVGEWFYKYGALYGDVSILPWFAKYKYYSDLAADVWSSRWGFPRPIAVRAIAPTGTISIVAETTSGIEPLFAPAYERRYLTKQGFQTEILVDPIAARYWEKGIRLNEYAHVIDYDTRIKFQHTVQQYVDNGISSTVNLPDTHQNPKEFGATLMKYLPGLRGITTFPNGSRGLQPITPVDFEYALKHKTRFESTDNACPSGVCSL
jgi:ribonucleoside-diphosphate reductase alpha chain